MSHRVSLASDKNCLVFHMLESFANLCLDFFAELGIVRDKLLCGLTSLSEFLVTITEP